MAVIQEKSKKSIGINIESLLESGAHFGHQKRRWNPKMKKYIYCVKNNMHVIDLEKTMYSLDAACNFIFNNIKNNKCNILFVCTKRKISSIVKEAAINQNIFYVDNRWFGGTLTNSFTIRKSINKMQNIDNDINNNSNNMTKQELSLLNKKSEKLHKNFDGIKDMYKIPDLVFVVDVKRESIAVSEANKMNIPVIGIIDTDGNPDNIDYPIPSNDDSVKTISEIMKVIEYVISVAKEIGEKNKEKKKNDKITSTKKLTIKKSDNSKEKEIKNDKKEKNNSADNIKTLRNKTGAGLVDCKNALLQSKNDIDKAVELLRKTSIIKAEKRNSRITQCGKIFTNVNDDCGIILEALCETDFTSKNDKFIKTIESIISECMENTEIKDDIAKYINKTKNEDIASISLNTGENIKIQRAIKLIGKCKVYTHTNGNIGVILKYDTEDKEENNTNAKLKEICMHIAAFNPKYITSNDIPNELIEKEKSIYSEQLKENNKTKSPDMLENILTNKIRKWYGEICLYQQPWIKDEKITTEAAIGKIKVVEFLRWQIGISE